MKVEPEKWRSLEGKRQMRVTPSAYNGGHGMGGSTAPDTPHAHFEFLRPTGMEIMLLQRTCAFRLILGIRGVNDAGGVARIWWNLIHLRFERR